MLITDASPRVNRMDSAGMNLPQDLAACHALLAQQAETIAGQQATIAAQQATLDAQQVTIDGLMADVALLKRSLFGSRRERFVDDPRQGYLFESTELKGGETSTVAKTDEEPQPETSLPRHRTSHGRGRRVFPAFLPRKPLHHRLNDEDIPAELRNDPAARRFFKKTSEQVEFEPPTLYVIEHYQEVIARDDETGEATMVTAAKPPQLIDAYIGPGFLAYLTASRFADHLPYYRQEDILSRYGFRIGRSTQWRWMFALAEGVQPLVDLMRRSVLRSRVLGVDETPVTMLTGDPKGSRKSYLWGAVGDQDHPYDCFYFTINRSRDGPEQFLSDYRGYLQSDAYICYELITQANEAVLRVGCWAHARRKFEELNFAAPSVRTHTALGYFQRLYDIEDRARDLSEPERYALRQREARPIVREFHQWLVEHSERELPKSKLRAAIGYMINRWEAFERYLECGAIPIDNNRTEAILKFAVLGRRAWLFFGNEQGGAAAANLFTLTKSCNRHRVDPFAYLRDVYTRLPMLPASELESLLPDRWIREHPEHLIQERVDEARQRAQRTRIRRAWRRRLLPSNRDL
jgi:transposase